MSNTANHEELAMQTVPAMPLVASLDAARRFARPAWNSDHVAAAEWAILLGAGVSSAVAGRLFGGYGIPGSTLLQVVLPMAAGLALVPRRGSGLTMGTSAVAAGLAMMTLGAAHINPSELARLFLLGVCLEVGPARAGDRRWVWLWFVAAGLAANALGFAFKVGSALLGWEGISARGLPWPAQLASFAICGALAGGVSGVIFFRRDSARERAEADQP